MWAQWRFEIKVMEIFYFEQREMGASMRMAMLAVHAGVEAHQHAGKTSALSTVFPKKMKGLSKTTAHIHFFCHHNGMTCTRN
jgi:hypothetical protein